MLPKVSIIIPTYNRASYLLEALESVLNQTYPNIEIVVVNDASTDDTEIALAPYMKYIQYFKRKKRGGCATTKNTGLELSTGEFITNVDDDDRIYPEKIERQVQMFRQHPTLGLCATGVNFIDVAGRVTGQYIPPRLCRKTQVIQLLRSCVLVQSSVMIRRKCHRHLGDYKLTHSQDYDFWLRSCLHYDVSVIPEPLAEYRHHGGQITGLHNRPEVRRAVEEIVLNFLMNTAIDEIIPGICSYPEGHTILGLALCEQRLFKPAQAHFALALPSPAGHFGFFLLKLHERKFNEAKKHVKYVKQSDSPLASKVEEGLLLMKRAQAVTQNPKVFHNTSPEVVGLRNDLSCFRTSVIRQLLARARGEISE